MLNYLPACLPACLCLCLSVYLPIYISLSLSVLTRFGCFDEQEALNGNYVNFGVFELYGDKALESALDVALSLALSVPVDQVLVYQKLSLWYYKLLDALFQSHLPYIASKDTATFIKLMEVLYEGLSSLEAPQVSA